MVKKKVLLFITIGLLASINSFSFSFSHWEISSVLSGINNFAQTTLQSANKTIKIKILEPKSMWFNFLNMVNHNISGLERKAPFHQNFNPLLAKLKSLSNFEDVQKWLQVVKDAKLKYFLKQAEEKKEKISIFVNTNYYETMKKWRNFKSVPLVRIGIKIAIDLVPTPIQVAADIVEFIVNYNEESTNNLSLFSKREYVFNP